MKIDKAATQPAKAKSTTKAAKAKVTKTKVKAAKAKTAPKADAKLTRERATDGFAKPTIGAAESFSNKGREIEFKMLGKANAIPAIPNDIPEPEGPVLDSVVVGGGLSGLSAMFKMGSTNTKLLEWGDGTGGLAAEAHRGDKTYDRGAAYFTWPEGEIMKFYKEIGMGSPKKAEIHEPIDSYLYNGKLYQDVFSEETLKHLPEGFSDFKDFIGTLDDGGFIGVQPFEGESEKVKMYDRISTADLIKPFGPEVKEFLDLYCQSALGAKSDKVSAMAFLNFYVNEMGPRYTFPGGTGAVATQIAKRVEQTAPGRIESRAFVYDVHNRPDGLVEVRYNKDGKNHALLAKSAIVTTPTSIAANIVKDIPDDQKKAMTDLEHANYLVHNFFTKDLVYGKGYDTWMNKKSFTDVIVGNWMATKGFKTKDSKKGEQILTVYQPLPEKYWKSNLDQKTVKHLAERALKDLDGVFPKMLKQQHIEIESSRWPQSIHITKPGMITGTQGDLIRRPLGGISFAGMNMGVPAFEEAIYRGMRSAEFATARSADNVVQLPVAKAGADAGTKTGA